MLETVRELLRDTKSWTPEKEELDEYICITIEELNRWKKKLLKILGITVDK